MEVLESQNESKVTGAIPLTSEARSESGTCTSAVATQQQLPRVTETVTPKYKEIATTTESSFDTASKPQTPNSNLSCVTPQSVTLTPLPTESIPSSNNLPPTSTSTSAEQSPMNTSEIGPAVLEECTNVLVPTSAANLVSTPKMVPKEALPLLATSQATSVTTSEAPTRPMTSPHSSKSLNIPQLTSHSSTAPPNSNNSSEPRQAASQDASNISSSANSSDANLEAAQSQKTPKQTPEEADKDPSADITS